MEKYFKLYKITKNGLINGTAKKCLCGEETTENKCPKCGVSLAKANLLNVSKNKALAKRYEKIQDTKRAEIQEIELLSVGFELYEQVSFKLVIDFKEETFTVSNTNIFKKEPAFIINFLSEVVPDFGEMVKSALNGAEGVMYSHLGALPESNINNIFHIYLNYKGLFPYLLKYKTIYYGKQLNIKDKFPEIDFNNEESVKKLGDMLYLFKYWDIKNVNYIDSIIEIAKDEKVMSELKELIIEFNKEVESIGYYHINGNEILDTFGMLFNKQISIPDFIRIFRLSSTCSFTKMNYYASGYKKIYKKEVDWSSKRNVSESDIHEIELKLALKSDKIKDSKIKEIFELVHNNPVKALKELSEVLS